MMYCIDDFLIKEKTFIYKLILLIFENPNKSLFFWELKNYSNFIIRWIWQEKYMKTTSKSISEDTNYNLNKTQKNDESTLFSKLRVQIVTI